MEIKIGQVYKHFKGDLYLVLGIVTHSETNEKMIHYKALYGDCIEYVRPYSSFIEKLDKNKYPSATQEYRFELQKIESIKK